MDKRTRQKYWAFPLRKLRRLSGDLQELIFELESGPRREIDIAVDHNGDDPTLIAQVLRTEGDPKSNHWYQVERIFCSTERCPSCPHGDFRYRYRRSKNGKITKKYTGKMAFDHETIERLSADICEGASYIVEINRRGDKTT